MASPWQNEGRLDQLVTANLGDVREAVRQYTGTSLSALARKMGVSRATLNHTLANYPNRKNPPVRRLIEVELELPPYALDIILEED